MDNKLVKGTLDFIEKSPTAFHAVKNLGDELEANGYLRLSEGKSWSIKTGEKYYVTRNGSALIAFQVPAELESFNIVASHSDSPALKLKENAEIEAEGHYVKLNVEKYGGMLMAPWFDRPLSIAGRVVAKTSTGVKSVLVDIQKDLLMLPSLAIHMNREANDGYKYNAQKDMLPTIGDINSKGELMKLVAEAASVGEEDILSYDLYVYNRQSGTIWGPNDEFISSARLDDLECAYAGLKSILKAEPRNSMPVLYVADNEEVGSSSRQGAGSTFLEDVLVRALEALGRERDYRRLVANSMMLSADNAHAVHPNHGDKSCPTNKCFMNEGVVIKYSANQKYTTDGVSAAVFKAICDKAKIPYQTFFNRSDMAGGSTLGNILTNKLPVKSVDIGLAQLAMHSPYETAGSEDISYMISACKAFFETSVYESGEEINIVQ